MRRATQLATHSFASLIFRGAFALCVGACITASGGCQQSPPIDVTHATVLDQNHITFNQMLITSGVDATLHEGGPYTLFAPTDDAFAQLSAERLADLRNPQNRDQLRSLLLTHVVKGQMSEAELSQAAVVTTFNGKTLTITGKPGSLSVERALIVSPASPTQNGVVFSINAVLQP
jgi:uncharacterized surface protein with fasciclin (FAS1) repeats